MTQSDIINNNFSKAFECIKCSNAYSTGEVLSEEKLFKQISERKHSTFDLSKFTVVGSPTITDDGVASGFSSSSNYLTIPKLSSLVGSANSWELDMQFTTPSDITSSRVGYLLEGNTDWCNLIRVGGDGTNYTGIQVCLTSTGSSYNIASYKQVAHVTANTTYWLKLIFTGTEYLCKYSTNGTDFTTVNIATSSLKISDNSTSLNIGVSKNATNSFRGSIDLKQFSITVDGKEVFSGNKTGIDVINDIEIPYTLSKTGSKIVDVAYRDRVIDLYEQQGQAGYYTIDEPNKNFTLPMGEIYGMIGGSSSTGGSGLEICDIGMALYVDETKGLRRYLNGQIVDINTNTQAFLNRLKEITTLHPSLLCTEEEWQTAKTMSAFGQVGKFVFNYSGGEIVSVRLPRVVNVQGLFDLQNLGMTVEAGLPNITGIAQTAPGRANYVANGALAIYATQNATNVYDNGATATNTQYGISFNASRSNPIYGKSSTVQPEAIQYPYFIQIATGSETENNIINEIELNNPYSLFDSKYSDHELNNLSWLKSVGQWNAKAVYPDAYDKLLKVYNGTETVEGLSVKLSTEEYTDYDFVLNTADETFRLPLLNGSESLPSDNFLNWTSYVTAMETDLPTAPYNGYLAFVGNGTATAGYIICVDTQLGQGSGQSIGQTHRRDIIFLKKGDRAHIYINDVNGVESLKFIKAKGNGSLYFYIGETVQNANLIDAGRISEVIPNKLDKKQLYNKVTNCLLEVPQRIKLALENGKMHLYKGSVLTYGDGSSLTIEEDVIEDQFVNTTHDGLVLVYDVQRSGNKLGIYIQGGNVFSQDTQPTTTYADSIWFDTANNKMKQTHDTGATWYEIPLPIGIVSVTPNVWKSLDRVFNGVGYVGNTFWVDKGVKGLIPNGRNEDGTLKNVEYETPFLMRTMNRDGDWELIYDPIGTDYNFKLRTFGNDVYLDKHTNQWVNLGTGTMQTKLYTNLASVRMSSGTVTKFVPREPFEATNIWSIRYESSTQTLYLG